MRFLWPIINTVQLLLVLAWTVVWTSIAMLLSLITFNGDIALWMARRIYSPGILAICLARFRPEPLPDIDWSKPHIFAMNHESALDIACAFTALPVNLRFIAKHSLKYIPFLGWYMSLTKMVFVNRSSRADAVRSLAAAGARIREGANIIAFPEGTRSATRQVLPFKKGPFMVALEAQVPIVPIAVGTGGVLPAGRFTARPGTVRMKVGQPIPTAGRGAEDREALMNEVREAIIKLHEEIGGRGAIEKTGAPVASPEVPSGSKTALS